MKEEYVPADCTIIEVAFKEFLKKPLNAQKVGDYL